MARSVRVGDVQAMQRGATNGATVATASDDGPGPDPTLTVAEQLDADLRLDGRVIDQAAWLSHRLRAALSKRRSR
jgi:hypothetical protein